MHSWVRDRITYANVAATLALAAALGGGYALAAGNADKAPSGGSILHAAVKPKEFDPMTMLTLPGIGKLIAECDNSGRVLITLKNTSGRTLVANDLSASTSGVEPLIQEVIADGATADYGNEIVPETDRVSLVPANPKGDRPQAELTLDTQPSCERAAATVVSSQR